MSLNGPTITAEIARHVLWQYGQPGGYRPGTFTQKLLDLLAFADLPSLVKLFEAFSAEAEAVRIAQYDEDGIAKLTAIALGEVAA